MSILTNILPGVLALLSGLYFYYYFRRIAEFVGIRTELTTVRAGMAVLAAVFVLPAADIWGVWAVVVFHMLFFSVLTDIIHAVVRRMGKSKRGWDRLYQSGILPVATVGILLLYGWWNMHHVTETTYTVYTEKDIRENGYRIVFLSDLHYGTTMNAEKLTACCERISGEGADLVILGGDLVDEHTTAEEMREAFEVLSGIRTKYGIYYIYGNHDRGFYEEEPYFSVKELEQAITENGIQILQDEGKTINGELTLIGRDDRTNPEHDRRKSAKSLIAQADQNQFLLLLDHQPKELETNAALGYDLQLSGHTHGGQIWPVGKLCGLLGFGELNYGYRSIGSFQVIVSSGLGGCNYALRTGEHSEYVVVNLLGRGSSRTRQQANLPAESGGQIIARSDSHQESVSAR